MILKGYLVFKPQSCCCWSCRFNFSFVMWHITHCSSYFLTDSG